jgi:hypothetical protein
VSGRLTAELPSGRHDAGLRRQSTRKGRERGCSLYIAAEELQAAGIDLDGLPPRYRVWAGRKRTLVVSLYPQPTTED